MVDIAIVTCRGPNAEVAGDVDGPLAAALVQRDVTVERVAWDEPGHDWATHDLAVVRSTWDYFERRSEFLAWAERVEGVTRLVNPAAVLAWNTDKHYLRELEDRGAPVVATLWVQPGDDVDLAGELRRRGWTRAVVKPTVDAGATGLVLVDLHDGESLVAARAARDRAAEADLGLMVQPFLSTIAEHGELSLVFLGGSYSHAVRKLPRDGDFRVQVQFGGRYEPEDPDQRTIDLAHWILEATGERHAYARVDLVRGEDDAWLLGELELAEPDLYLHHAPEAADRLAEVLLDLADPPAGAGPN